MYRSHGWERMHGVRGPGVSWYVPMRCLLLTWVPISSVGVCEVWHRGRGVHLRLFYRENVLVLIWYSWEGGLAFVRRTHIFGVCVRRCVSVALGVQALLVLPQWYA